MHGSQGHQSRPRLVCLHRDQPRGQPSLTGGLDPPSRRTRALMALGKTADARAALAQAMRTEPENAEALELKARLK